MKPFKFTLEAVRTVRQRKENEAMEAYAKALLARRQAMEQLEAVQQKLSDSWKELRQTVTQGCNALEAARIDGFRRTLEKRRNECMGFLALAERLVNNAWQALIAARQQREVVDTGYEKQKSAHEREQMRAEQKAMDDLAGRRIASPLSWSPAEGLP